MALVKKDKPEEELKKSCLDQLEVFLQHNTSDFVNTFFKAVHDKSYLNPQPVVPDPAVHQKPHNTSSVPSDVSTVASAPTGNPADSDDLTTSDRRSNRRSSRSRSPARKQQQGTTSSRSTGDDHRRGGGRYDRKRDTDRDTTSSKSFSRRRSTTRSRSPSPLTLASRRRNRSSRSPVPVSRKRSASKSPDGRDAGVKAVRKERCRDFDERGFCMRGDQCPFVTSHSDPVVLDAEPFLSHNRTSGPPQPASGPTGGLLPPPDQQQHQEYDPRNPSMDMGPGSQRPLLGHAPNNVVVPATGVPANPNYPPPPVVGQWGVPSGPVAGGGVGGHYVPAGRPNLNVIIPDSGPMTGDMSHQQQHGLQSTVTVVNHNSHHHHHAQMMHHQHPNANPHMMHPQQHMHQQQQQPPHMMHQMQHQQMMSGHQHQQQGQHQQIMHHNGRGGGGRGGRGGFAGRGRGRGGFGGRGGGGQGMMYGGRPLDQPERCTLEVRRLPAHLNTIATLNDYFSKFGTIVNLQIKYENDPEAAVVQFASHAEAASAHRCPEAVLGNRFIKLFWHNKEQEKQDPAPEKMTEEGTEGDDRPVDRSAGMENGGSGIGAEENSKRQDDDDEDKNRLPVKERLDLKPLDDVSFKLQVSTCNSVCLRTSNSNTNVLYSLN